MQFKKLHLSAVRFICYFICFTVFLWNGWPKCLQEPNIYDVHLTWRMRNIDHAVVLSWIKRKIYSSTYIKVHAKWNIILQFIFYFNLLGAVFWIILEKQFLCPKKSGISRFPLLVLPNHFGIWTTKKIIHITRLFYNSNLRIKSYHLLTEIDLVFYHHLYQFTQL